MNIKDTRLIMGMPITIELCDESATDVNLEAAFARLHQIDNRFSTYKQSSEISAINAGTLRSNQWSSEMQYVISQCERTKIESNGYFDIRYKGFMDPSGFVKGWAIQETATLLSLGGLKHYYVEAGGDMQVAGSNSRQEPWTVGIRNPFNDQEIIKRLSLSNCGMATSGTYIRGQHIYNPFRPDQPITDLVSLSVIAPSITDADRFATAAFAMGNAGIAFIAKQPQLEGYAIDHNKVAIFTPGFGAFVLS